MSGEYFWPGMWADSYETDVQDELTSIQDQRRDAFQTLAQQRRDLASDLDYL